MTSVGSRIQKGRQHPVTGSCKLLHFQARPAADTRNARVRAAGWRPVRPHRCLNSNEKGGGAAHCGTRPKTRPKAVNAARARAKSSTLGRARASQRARTAQVREPRTAPIPRNHAQGVCMCAYKRWSVNTKKDGPGRNCAAADRQRSKRPAELPGPNPSPRLPLTPCTPGRAPGYAGVRSLCAAWLGTRRSHTARQAAASTSTPASRRNS